MNKDATYTSAVPWKNDSQHTLVIACSDPRTAVATYEFLEQQCNLYHFDPIMKPGGPGTLLTSAMHFFVTRGEIHLLHERHTFKRVIGIVHEDCGWYKHKYPQLDADQRRQRQTKDLHEFHKEILKLIPNATVELYVAEPDPVHHHVQFREVV